MAKTVKPIIRSQGSAPPIAQQQAIAQQTAAFLAQGGKIQKIPNGVSGQRLGGPHYLAQGGQGAQPDAQKAGAARNG